MTSSSVLHNMRLVADEPGDLTPDHACGEILLTNVRASQVTNYGQWMLNKVGMIVQTCHDDGCQDAARQFIVYQDQSLRRDSMLDRNDACGQFHGWRNAQMPEGFVVPAGVVPGVNGCYVMDDTTLLQIAIPDVFSDLCGRLGMTPEQLLRGFIADLCRLESNAALPRADGYSSNGSDEEMLANDYVDRAYGHSLLQD